jgi:hypothetical protein
MVASQVVEQVSIEQLAAIAGDLGLQPQIGALEGRSKAIMCRFPNGPGMIYLLGTRDFEPAFAFISIRPGRHMNETQANAWNRDNGFGAIFLDPEGTPWLRHSVLLRGGATREFVCFQFGLFDMMIKSFFAAVG